MQNFKKEIYIWDGFYMSQFYKDPQLPYLIFLHGGPGFNSALLEYFIENQNLFHSLHYNLILYDQRNCGRSTGFDTNVTHHDNITDLYQIYQFFVKEKNLNIKGIMGHSYGAKLLYDFYKKYTLPIVPIFLGISDNMLWPRFHNVSIGIAYLRKTDPQKYEELFEQLDDIDLNKLWKITGHYTEFFFQNKDRQYLYWANLQWLEKYHEAQKIINLPMNLNTFKSVRNQLYANEASCEVNIPSLEIPYLWINGIHDFIMNGMTGVLSHQSHITLFYKSAHYPHIEENEKFCQKVNMFLK